LTRAPAVWKRPRGPANTGAGDGYGKIALSGTGTADQHGIALVLEERASGKITHQPLIDGRVAKIEVGQLLGQR
jgi:hypothetical protein